MKENLSDIKDKEFVLRKTLRDEGYHVYDLYKFLSDYMFFRW